MNTLTQPLKWHGGKSYLAKSIIALMPPRCKNPNKPAPDDPGWLHYVEPYFGGGAVLLANDPEGISEVVNDKNLQLVHFWNVLQDGNFFLEFQKRITCVPFSSREFEFADPDMGTGPIDMAVKFFVRCRQSLAGRMDSFAPLTRNRTRRGMNEQASAWLNAVEGLPAVHERLKRVVILNGDALDVIRQQDGPRTLVYADPPYLSETREAKDVYEHEMTFEDHSALLAVLRDVKGRFLLSGYHSNLYDGAAKKYGWKCHEFKIDNKAASGKTKRQMTECVWCNY